MHTNHNASTESRLAEQLSSELPVDSLSGLNWLTFDQSRLTNAIAADAESTFDDWTANRVRSEAEPVSDLTPCANMILQLAPPMSITGASSSISLRADQGREIQIGGIDTLVARCFGSWDEDRWNETLAHLIEAKDKAEHEGLAVELDYELTQLSGVIMLPDSVYKRHEGVYQFHLQFDGCNVIIRNQQAEHDRLPSLIIELGSLVLMHLGHTSAWRAVLSMLDKMGFIMSKAVPSRVDPCVDVVGLSMEEIIAAHIERRVIRLARDGATHFSGLKDTGYELGKGAIKLRAYDKLQELNDKPGPSSDLKREVLESQRWGGKPEKATRIEFQLRRDALREVFNIETVDQLFEQLPHIVAYLTEKWVRFTSEKVDRDNKNQTRAEVADWWLRVRDAFLSWAGQPEQPKAERVKKPLVLRQLGLQVLGCLESFGAAMGASCDNLGDLIWHVIEQLESIQIKRDEQAQYRGARTIDQRIELKRSKLAARLASKIPTLATEVPF